MWWTLIYQSIPIPTPTPFPDTPVEDFGLEVPNITLWDFADDAIQIWNKTNPVPELLKAVIIIGLIVGVVMIIVGLVNRVTEKRT